MDTKQIPTGLGIEHYLKIQQRLHYAHSVPNQEIGNASRDTFFPMNISEVVFPNQLLSQRREDLLYFHSPTVLTVTIAQFRSGGDPLLQILTKRVCSELGRKHSLDMMVRAGDNDCTNIQYVRMAHLYSDLDPLFAAIDDYAELKGEIPAEWEMLGKRIGSVVSSLVFGEQPK